MVEMVKIAYMLNLVPNAIPPLAVHKAFTQKEEIEYPSEESNPDLPTVSAKLASEM